MIRFQEHLSQKNHVINRIGGQVAVAIHGIHKFFLYEYHMNVRIYKMDA